MHYYGIGKFCIAWYEIDYYNCASILRELTTNFKLNKSKLLIWFEMQNIIDIQLFQRIGRKRLWNQFQISECFIYVNVWSLSQVFALQMLIYEYPIGLQRIMQILYHVIGKHENI